MDYDRDRIAYIGTLDGLRKIHGKALILAEAGYSHSGIANKLDVNETTARKYLDDLQDKFGKNVIECKPKSETFPETHPETDTGVTGY